MTKILTPTRANFCFFRSEITLLFGRVRNLVGLAGLALVPIIVTLSVKLSSSPEGPPFITHVTQNGVFVILTSLSVSLPLFLPIGVGAVSADTIAGEAQGGTLRYLLSVPVDRGTLLLNKYLAVCVFALAMVGTIVISGAVSGLAVFPRGDVTLLSGSEVSLGDGIARAGAAAVYVSILLMAMGALGIFLSTLTEQPLGAMIAVVALIVASEVIAAISSFSVIHPYLLPTHYLSFTEFTRTPVMWEPLWHGVATSLAYIAIFLTAAWARLCNREITS